MEERETGGYGGDQASRGQSFVEGGLKITSSFVKQSEKGRRNSVSKNCSVHTNNWHETWQERKSHNLRGSWLKYIFLIYLNRYIAVYVF